MAKKNPAVDAYIARSADFARPVLEHFRALVHKTCPGATEVMKWSFPHFDYNNGPMCHMASFKKHCAIGFWKASLMKDAELLTEIAKSEVAMGHLGRITSLEDLPKDKVIIAWIKDAMRLNDEGIKVSPKKTGKPAKLVIPDYFNSALKSNKKAFKTFEAFTNSQRKEYVEWVTEAKTESTREKRLETAIEWMAEGKTRHWKYK